MNCLCKYGSRIDADDPKYSTQPTKRKRKGKPKHINEAQLGMASKELAQKMHKLVTKSLHPDQIAQSINELVRLSRLLISTTCCVVLGAVCSTLRYHVFYVLAQRTDGTPRVQLVQQQKNGQVQPSVIAATLAEQVHMILLTLPPFPQSNTKLAFGKVCLHACLHSKIGKVPKRHDQTCKCHYDWCHHSRAAFYCVY